MILTKNRLSKIEINNFELVEFRKNITLVDTPEKSVNAYNYLSAQDIVGIDTETRPAFNKGEFYPVSLVQFSTNDEAFIFQLEHCGFKDVQALLESEAICKVGLALRDDFIDLKKTYGSLNQKNIKDLGQISHKMGIIQTGVRTLSARYLERRISKSMQVSNWSKKDLSEKQIRYAATDAWICLQIYPKLIADKTDYFKLKELEEEQKI